MTQNEERLLSRSGGAASSWNEALNASGQVDHERRTVPLSGMAPRGGPVKLAKTKGTKGAHPALGVQKVLRALRRRTPG